MSRAGMQGGRAPCKKPVLLESGLMGLQPYCGFAVLLVGTGRGCLAPHRALRGGTGEQHEVSEREGKRGLELLN